jgi:hypothetical protein
MRPINYETILKKVNGFISSKPKSTTHKEFVDSFKGVLSAKEADKFWDRLLALGNVLYAIDCKRYGWLVNTSWFTAQSLEKHFRQGDVLSKRGRIPGKKYSPKIKEERQKPLKQGIVIYPGWISTLSI